MLSLMCSVKHKSQLAGLHVIAGLALTSEASARKLLTPNVLQVCPETLPGELGSSRVILFKRWRVVLH